jgi:hypothetical protein
MHEEEEEDEERLHTNKKQRPVENVFVTAHDYVTRPSCLDKMTVSEIRCNLKHYRESMNFKSGGVYSVGEFQYLKTRFKLLYDYGLVGKHDKLAARLMRHFENHHAAVQIQRHLRGFFVRYCLSLRGPALRNRAMCTNTKDAYSLEPIAEIPCMKFFSYTERDNFIYGFDTDSILQVLARQSSHKFLNPYNRMRMDSTLPSIRRLLRLTSVIEGTTFPSQVKLPKPVYVPLAVSGHRGITEAVASATTRVNYNIEEMILRMREIRARTFEDRAQTLFMEMDLMGHFYTQASWFTALETRDVERLLRYLQEYWVYRAHLPAEVKMRICPLWDPFIWLNRGDLTSTQARVMCLSVMEDMVFTGVDAESRMLGSFHVLTCLTLVSLPARSSLSWLYESVPF